MEGHTAVITGAANGMGLAAATKCALEYKMKVVMCDVVENELNQAVNELNNKGGKCLAVVADVTRMEDYENMLVQAKVFSGAGGNVDFVFLNAGVMGTGISLMNKSTVEDFEWVFDVNVKGVLRGIKTFVPAILEQGRPSLIAATASSQGLDIGGPPGSTSSYAVSKHAVVSMMESLEGEIEFKNKSGHIKTAVLCPGGVSTSIWKVDRQEKTRRDGKGRGTVTSNRRKEQLKELFESSVSAKDAMDQFFKDLHDGLFICSTEPGLALEIFQRRSDYILEKKHPSDMRARI